MQLLNYIKNSNKIGFFITNSIGELDIILPLIYLIKKRISKKIDFEIIIVPIFICNEFQKSQAYKKIIKKLNINVYYKSFSFFKLNATNIFKINSIIELTNLFLNLPFILIKSIGKDYLFIENSGRSYLSCIINFLLYFKKKNNIILFPHTSGKFSCKTEIISNEFPRFLNKSPFLIYNLKNELSYFRKNKYFGNPLCIKYPLNINWKDFIKDNFQIFKKKQYIVIYLNNLIDRKSYIYTLLIILNQFNKKKFFEKKIYIKRHPRKYQYIKENEILNKIKKKFYKLNLEITEDNSFFLSAFAKINICLMTNAIFLCKSMNENSFYFHIDSFEVKRRYKNSNLPMQYNYYDKYIGYSAIVKKINRIIKKIK